MIATHTLMIVRSLILVEHIASQVQHAIVERRIGQNLTVGIGHGAHLLALHLLHKLLGVVGVQIATVHCPQVCETQHQQASHQHPSLELRLHAVGQEHQRAHQDDEERAPAVGREHSLTGLTQRLEQRIGTGRWRQDLSKQLGLGLRIEIKECGRCHSKQQGHTTRQAKGH